MSTTVNNNDASSSSIPASNNAESFDLRMKSMEDQINNLSLAFTRFMKEPMFSSNTNSRSQRTHDDSDTEIEQSDDESSNNVDVPTDYQLSDTLLGQYKHMVNNQDLLVEEECILKKDEISELNKVFNFPSNFQVNVAPFGTPEGITVSSTVKNNDTDLNTDSRTETYIEGMILYFKSKHNDRFKCIQNEFYQNDVLVYIFLHKGEYVDLFYGAYKSLGIVNSPSKYLENLKFITMALLISYLVNMIIPSGSNHLNKIKEKQINSQCLLEIKKNPNLYIEEINDICYLSEDGFKKLIIIDKETIHTVIREYHDTKYSGHHALDISYYNIRQYYYFN
ncbi:hypothetical protein ACTFIW_000765 [Dictyostelium discoideum]